MQQKKKHNSDLESTLKNSLKNEKKSFLKVIKHELNETFVWYSHAISKFAQVPA